MPRDPAPSDPIAPWILGALVALLSLFGLFMASGATDAGFYHVGLLFFLFGVLFIFGLIGRYVGR
jgi:uncharacterized membrane protein